MNRLQMRSTVGILLSFICVLSYALPTDREQIMQVLADTASLNQKNHRGIYKGNVQLTQGTTNIQATFALTKGNDNNQLSIAIAKGSENQQAHYWTQTEPNKPLLHAYANVIRYYPLTHLIKLVGNARVEQGDNSLSAETITYDMVKQEVQTVGNKKDRIKILLSPEKATL